jgi:glutamine amidotransferase-like uncharacterized protein
LKPARTNNSQDPILKIPNTKGAGGVAQGVGPEFNPRYCKKKKKEIKTKFSLALLPAAHKTKCSELYNMLFSSISADFNVLFFSFQVSVTLI